MDKWRKIANTILHISIVISSLGVVILAYRLIDDDRLGEFFVVLIGGAFVILSAHTILGMFIELCNNVAELKNKNIIRANDGLMSTGDSNRSLADASAVKAVSTRDKWKCNECGTVNDKKAWYCSCCGKKGGLKNEIVGER